MDEPDPVMEGVARGIALGHQGERERARELLGELWDEVGAHGDPLHRCAVAHSMADVVDDVHEELAWDLRALSAADELRDDRLDQAGVAVPVRAFYPSLHLNLGDAYQRLGDPDRARHHLEAGRAAVGALGDDGYGTMVREALDRLASRIGAPPV